MPASSPLACLVALALVAGCRTTHPQANKELVQAMVEAINDRDFAALDAVVAEDVERHCAATPDADVKSLDDFKAFLKQDLAAVPDAVQEVHFMVAEGDKVAVYATYKGTQSGAFGPFPPSGKTAQAPFIGIVRIADDKIAELWVEWDNLGILTQLGHFPPPGMGPGGE